MVDLIRDWVALVNTVWHKMVNLSGFKQSNVLGGWRKSGSIRRRGICMGLNRAMRFE